MNLYQLIFADWRIRLLAQATCAPRSRRTAARPTPTADRPQRSV
jgi:hypothetical protein